MPSSPLESRDSVPIYGPTWQHRLDNARTPEDLLRAVRDYMARFDPLELAALPEACRPPERFIAEDIAPYAFELVRREQGAVTGEDDVLHKLARFFSHASMRLSQVTAYGPAAAAEARDRESA